MEVAKEQKHTRELDFYMRFERIAKEVMEKSRARPFPPMWISTAGLHTVSADSKGFIHTSVCVQPRCGLGGP